MKTSVRTRRLLKAAPIAMLASGAVAVPSASADLATAVSTQRPQQVITFDTATPATTTAPVVITGVASNELITGIDRRPLTGAVYAVSTERRIFTIDTLTGVATPVSPTPFGPAFTRQQAPGFDFNPTVDKMRITYPQTQNLRVDPLTGATVGGVLDQPLKYAPTDVNANTRAYVVGSAYSNNDNDPMTGTTLYDVDAVSDSLLIQDPPNAGLLNTIGELGINIDPTTGFDISPTGLAYVLTNVPGKPTSELYGFSGGQVGLGLSPTVTLIGSVGTSAKRYSMITVGIAVPPI